MFESFDRVDYGEFAVDPLSSIDLDYSSLLFDMPSSLFASTSTTSSCGGLFLFVRRTPWHDRYLHRGEFWCS